MLLLLAIGCSTPAPPSAPIHLRGAAASSLTDVLPAVTAQWAGTSGHDVAWTFDSTSRLAKQVDEGLAVDLFFAADTEWIEWLGERSLIRPESRRDVLGNELVVVVPQGASFVPSTRADLSDPRVERLALAGESVPAGKYGRAALTDTWATLEPRVVSGDSVRTVLGWVASGEVSAGVVYATDADVEPAVKVAFAFPAASHPPIVYPAAVAASSTHPDEAVAFLAFCASPEARATFEAAGFEVITP